MTSPIFFERVGGETVENLMGYETKELDFLSSEKDQTKQKSILKKWTV